MNWDEFDPSYTKYHNPNRMHTETQIMKQLLEVNPELVNDLDLLRREIQRRLDTLLIFDGTYSYG